jgi:hypothetical protein
MTFRQFRIISIFGLSAAFFCGTMVSRVNAQANTATILGTVTDTSSGAIPDAKVQVTNTGTGATQVTETDSQGRYRVPVLPIGEYDIQSEKEGFQSAVHKGITLTVGADVVVDFALSVGAVTQTVTVEGEVSQVETTSSSVGTLVEPTQMRELPLNGRSFEQLILLSPGVTVHQAIGYQPSNGTGNAYSVSGSRTRGQWELLDGNDVMDWQGRGSGSGVLGTQLGVDAIAEFQVLTNTYSAQFGGNGAVVNMVTRSGTNTLHGSGYEFVRNNVFDARNFFDPNFVPPFRKNQFGGTVGGPIKKDKMFFFFNYEGIRQNSSPLYAYIVPDEQAHYGFVPTNGIYKCVNSSAIAYDPNTYKTSGCQATIPAAIQNQMKNFALPDDPGTPIVGFVRNLDANGFNTGLITGQFQTQQPGSENYLVGRYDWTISQKDSLFGRYLSDGGDQLFPFSGSSPASTGVPGATVFDSTSQGRSLNQYIAIGERHVSSTNLILSSNLGYVRTLNYAYKIAGYPDYSFGDPNYWNQIGVSSSQFPSGAQGAINILPLVSPNITFSQLGGGNNYREIQNKYSLGEDVYWNIGAHAAQFGASIQRVQSYYLSPPSPGTWTFANMTTFLQDAPGQSTADCNAQVFAACANLPSIDPLRNYWETNFGLYFQDNWRVRSNLTLNVGMRYSPQTNPTTSGQLREWANLPLSASFNPELPMPGCTAPGFAGCTGALPAGTLPTTPVNNVYLKNISLHNFEPRIGLAWDPFNDHKTSVRAGYGIFRSPILPYDYTTAAAAAGPSASPYFSVAFSCAAPCSTFPAPPLTSATLPLLGGGGVDPGTRSTPYMEQWNLIVQRQITRTTIVSVGYVGSRGIHLIGHFDENPSLPTGVAGALIVCPGAAVVAGCNLGAGSYLMAGQGIASRLPGACSTLDPSTNKPAASCTPLAGGTVVQSSDGSAIVDSTTGQRSYQVVAYNPSTGVYSAIQNNRIDRNVNFSSMRSTQFWSVYNSLQASVARRFTNNLQWQVSYTYAGCLSNSSGTTGFENGMQVADPYNHDLDKGNCGFLVRHDISVNGIYMLPFKRNRLVSGWQLGLVGNYHTGEPVDISTGWPTAEIGARSGPVPPRPSVKAGCQQILGRIDKWFDPNCYYMAPIGEVGNVPFMNIFGPDFHQWDTSLVKNTKIGERFNLQFRWEIFNVLNRTNFRNPGQPMSFVYAQASVPNYLSGTGATSLPATCFSNPDACSTQLSTAGQLFATNGSSRQMQLGLKLTF